MARLVKAVRLVVTEAEGILTAGLHFGFISKRFIALGMKIRV